MKMAVVPTLGALLILASPATLWAGETATYHFRTQLVPVEQVSEVFTVPQQDVWVRGLLLPDRLVRLSGRPAIQHEDTDVQADEAFGLAYSSDGSLLACSIRQVMKFRMGRSHVCLIDTDRDGRFDGWFRRGDEIVIAHGLRKIPLADVRPVSPIDFTEIPSDQLSSLSTHSGFAVLRKGSEINFCRTYNGKIEDVCIRGLSRLKREPSPVTITLVGGVFEYRSSGKAIEVRLVEPVTRQPFLTTNY